MMKYRARSGFTTMELLGVMTLLALLGAGIWVASVKLKDRGQSASVLEVARQFNTSTAGYVESSGPLPVPLTAPSLLTLLQTPVDAKSRAAGFGEFPEVDHRLTLVAVGPGATGDRLVVSFDPKAKRPVWSVVSTGDGYVIKTDPTRTPPAAADWTAYVDQKAAVSQVGARKSKWLWDFEDTAASVAAPAAPAPTSTPDYATAAATLSITGPESITTAGKDFYWTGVSSIPGDLTLTVQGTATTASGASSLASPKRAFVAGEHASFDVSVARAEGGASTTKHVVVDVPALPHVSISGPDTITSEDDATWTASSSDPSSPIAIRVPGTSEVIAYEATQVSATHSAWSAGTQISDFKITASALNASGIDVATKFVQIDIPLPPPVVPPVVPPAIPGDPVIPPVVPGDPVVPVVPPVDPVPVTVDPVVPVVGGDPTPGDPPVVPPVDPVITTAGVSYTVWVTYDAELVARGIAPTASTISVDVSGPSGFSKSVSGSNSYTFTGNVGPGAYTATGIAQFGPKAIGSQETISLTVTP